MRFYKHICTAMNALVINMCVSAFVIGSNFQLVNPIKGGTENVEESVSGITEIAAQIISAIFGSVAFITLGVIAFTFFRDRSRAVDQLWGFGGGILLFSTAGAILAMLVAA